MDSLTIYTNGNHDGAQLRLRFSRTLDSQSTELMRSDGRKLGDFLLENVPYHTLVTAIEHMKNWDENSQCKDLFSGVETLELERKLGS